MLHNVKMTGAQNKVRPKGADAFVRPCRLKCYPSYASTYRASPFDQHAQASAQT